MDVKLLKAGVVGCGFIAQNAHIPALLKCRNVRLAAICDRNEDLARDIARKFKVGKYYTDFKEMLDVEKLNVVRFFFKPNRYGSWTETCWQEIDDLEYEDYYKIAPAQGGCSCSSWGL